MRIIYYARHGNRGSDDTEGHIGRSFEALGHEVVRVDEGSEVPTGDLLLFHKGGKNITSVLSAFSGLKVCWYFDKIDWNNRAEWFHSVLPLVDLMFITDGTWARTHPDPKLRVLRQGIGDLDTSRGVPREGVWKAQIAFLGGLYGERGKWAERLKRRYGEAFQIYGNVFNRDLYDLCETVPIIVAPSFPADDWYWSNRIYLTLGSGGFLIHPRLKGLSSEFKHGYHYVSYDTHEELEHFIDYFLEHEDERNKIRENGRRKTVQTFNFTRRCQRLLTETTRLRNTGTTESSQPPI